MNITNGPIGFKAYSKIYGHGIRSHIRYWFYGLLLFLAVILFLPWTQNIRAKGTVTTLRQEQRPQQLNTIIGGKIVKWHVKEGDLIQKGDTILQLAEIKDDYLDPALVNRTQEQLTAKELSVDYYKNKVNVTASQLAALETARGLKQRQLLNKLQQLRLKLVSDSMELLAEENELAITGVQFRRQKALFDSGLVSLTQLEQRNQAYQNAAAKKVSAENKLGSARQEVTITQIEINSVEQEYAEKLSKVQGEQFQSLSQIATGEGDIAKLKNQYTNYSIRSGLYYITAPQSGQVTKAKKAGLGEVVKEGEMLVEIVPDKIEYAVELFVRPVDLPLLEKGQKVRFLFDGFPAVVFSGWPRASFGTFGGLIVAVENSINSNGLFRILVAEDPGDKPWPGQLKVGAGANGIALLKNVPVWYELWRNINGFPPDYYQAEAAQKK
jgi:multidrug efflux pump subunit AcrA (membrane-fusion protein)